MIKIVFILSSSVNQNGIKRIDEFVENGYDVVAYGFNRGVEYSNKSKSVDINILASFSNDKPYLQRLGIMRKGIMRVLKETSSENCLYYLIGPDVAMIFTLICNKKYIYEEPDLVHTYIKNKYVRNILEKIDKRIIRKSVLSVFRSEGFPIYHFGTEIPDNCTVITNRLNKDIKKFSPLFDERKPFDLKHLRIGFVGGIRFNSIKNFAEVFCENYPDYEFHFYGSLDTQKQQQMFGQLKSFDNCHFHGSFKNPDDLPSIYSSFDLLLSTYDVEFENVRYAEPNKIYEAIYFETPIIVSRGTFLADKVKKLGIGYAVDPLDKNEIVSLIDSLSVNSLNEKVENMRKIPKEELINRNDSFFSLLEDKCKSLFREKHNSLIN